MSTTSVKLADVYTCTHGQMHERGTSAIIFIFMQTHRNFSSCLKVWWVISTRSSLPRESSRRSESEVQSTVILSDMQGMVWGEPELPNWTAAAIAQVLCLCSYLRTLYKKIMHYVHHYPAHACAARAIAIGLSICCHCRQHQNRQI